MMLGFGFFRGGPTLCGFFKRLGHSGLYVCSRKLDNCFLLDCPISLPSPNPSTRTKQTTCYFILDNYYQCVMMSLLIGARKHFGLLQFMRLRRAVPKIPSRSSAPPRSPLHKRRFLPTHSESTLLQVFIPRHFNSFRRNTYKKPGEGPLVAPTKFVNSSLPTRRSWAHTQTPATPIPSYVYFTTPCIPQGWGVPFSKRGVSRLLPAFTGHGTWATEDRPLLTIHCPLLTTCQAPVNQRRVHPRGAKHN